MKNSKLKIGISNIIFYFNRNIQIVHTYIFTNILSSFKIFFNTQLFLSPSFANPDDIKWVHFNTASLQWEYIIKPKVNSSVPTICTGKFVRFSFVSFWTLIYIPHPSSHLIPQMILPRVRFYFLIFILWTKAYLFFALLRREFIKTGLCVLAFSRLAVGKASLVFLFEKSFPHASCSLFLPI